MAEQNLCAIKTSCEELDVELEVIPVVQISVNSSRAAEIEEKIKDVDSLIEASEKKLAELNSEIDRLTNHADGLDYMVAVASGVISGLVDSLYVGEFSLSEGSKWGEDTINKFVKKIAKSQGYEGDELSGSVSFLEKKFPFAADKATSDFGGGLQHHLRDFSHHASPIGLFFSLLTQFTGKAYGTSTSGMFIVVDVSESGLIGDSLPSKLFLGVVQWFFHIVSDMAGSSSSIQAGSLGTGLPGPLLSLAKALSTIPIFQNEEISKTISRIFNGTAFGDRDEAGVLKNVKPFDLRAELGALQQLGKQAVPVIINECLVRGFYFIRHFYGEVKDKKIKSFSDLKRIEWGNVIPAKNRTIVRMLTIATGTFTLVDMADAAIRSAVKGGFTPAFWANFLLRVNFVGVGRFAIALYSDVKMGFEKDKKEDERRLTMNYQLYLLNAKVFYKQALVWIAAQDAALAIEQLEKTANQSMSQYVDSLQAIGVSLENVLAYIPKALEKNVDLKKDLLDILEA